MRHHTTPATPADLTTHPWVQKYRLPLVRTWFPRVPYLAALVVPPVEVLDHLPIEWPTEDEAKVLGEVIERLMSVYIPHVQESSRKEPLDVISGTNTLIFGKMADVGWTYRMASWTQGPPMYPAPLDVRAAKTDGFWDLEGLTDLIAQHASGLPGLPSGTRLSA